VIILLTDGRNNSGELSPETAAKLAKTLGVKVYAVGIGTLGDATFYMQTQLGIIENQPLDIKTLEKIAEITGGLAFQAQDNEQLLEVYSRINALEKYEIKTRRFSQYKELYPLFLWPGIILLILSVVLKRTRLKELP